MHGSTRNELENLLSGSANARALEQHLTSCRECAGEVAAMRSQHNLFRSLEPREEVELKKRLDFTPASCSALKNAKIPSGPSSFILPSANASRLLRSRSPCFSARTWWPRKNSTGI